MAKSGVSIGRWRGGGEATQLLPLTPHPPLGGRVSGLSFSCPFLFEKEKQAEWYTYGGQGPEGSLEGAWQGRGRAAAKRCHIRAAREPWQTQRAWVGALGAIAGL